jgi:hypothetical protein
VVALAFVGVANLAHADLCLQASNGIRYQLQVGTASPGAGTPVVVTGTRVIATFRTPVMGSITVLTDKLLVGLTEMFDFGSGSFTHPTGTTVLSFPIGIGSHHYDTTFHGNGAPHNVNGGFSTIDCPLADSVDTDARDPNGR